jgi:hypothetical protein
MTLERTELPLHMQTTERPAEEVSCDYCDVTFVEGDQPRYKLQPHARGGLPVGPTLIFETEGARSLIQHLQALLIDSTAD